MAKIIEAALATSAARTTTTSFEVPSALIGVAPDVLEICIVATALAATPSVVPSIEVYNSSSDSWVAILTGSAITTAAPTTVTLRVGPNVVAAANLAAPGIVGPRWRVTMTHGDADSITYSVQARVQAA